MPFYDKLAQLYGQDRASGDNAETAAEIREKRARLQSETVDDIDNLVANNDASLEGFETHSVLDSHVSQSQSPSEL